MENYREEIMNNVFLTYLPASKFKTSCLSIHMVATLSKETASLNALIPAVLRRGTMKHPNMESISAALDTLYGAQIDSSLRKKAERQCMGFVATFIDDKYTPNREKLLEPVVDLMCELLLDPLTNKGRFLSEYVESEKKNLIDSIRSLKNDKRDWAEIRLMQEMCADEPYGVLRLGDEKTLNKITNHKLFKHYQDMISSSRIEIVYCGSAPLTRLKGSLIRGLARLPRNVIASCLPITRVKAPIEPRYITEEYDVTQAKLAIGWRCETKDVPAMIIANLLFGGTSNSKLFMNVREKMSLCYYASSSYARAKGIMTVSSGIESKDYDKAFYEILNQLENVKNGEWEEWEWDSAIAMIVTSLESIYDSQPGLEGYYLGNVVTEVEDSPEDMIRSIKTLTAERVRDAASSCHLDTVYLLKGKEE